ncbi:MAG: hypothetical protein AMXMBFR7_16170 [Planctomycetota bacterium]
MNEATAAGELDEKAAPLDPVRQAKQAKRDALRALQEKAYRAERDRLNEEAILAAQSMAKVEAVAMQPLDIRVRRIAGRWALAWLWCASWLLNSAALYAVLWLGWCVWSAPWLPEAWSATACVLAKAGASLGLALCLVSVLALHGAVGVLWDLVRALSVPYVPHGMLNEGEAGE